MKLIDLLEVLQDDDLICVADNTDIDLYDVSKEAIPRTLYDSKIDRIYVGNDDLLHIVLCHNEKKSVTDWVEEYGDLDHNSIKLSYKLYKMYCADEGISPVGRNAFCKTIYDLGYKRHEIKDRDRKSIYVFLRL